MRYVVNVMEIWVENCLTEVLQNIDMCKCEKCLKDVYALSLNKLKPRYIIADKGINESEANADFDKVKIEIVECIKKSAEIVRKNPKHDGEEIPNIVNYAEYFVESYMKEIMKGDTFNHNDEYVRQIYVMVLNSIKPFYAVTKKGEMYNKIKTQEGQYKTNIFLEITRAIDIMNMKNNK